jgi:hypothetical protein
VRRALRAKTVRHTACKDGSTTHKINSRFGQSMNTQAIKQAVEQRVDTAACTRFQCY